MSKKSFFDKLFLTVININDFKDSMLIEGLLETNDLKDQHEIMSNNILLISSL